MSVVDETYSRGRRLVVEQPMAIVVGLVAALLVVDLLNRLITGRLPPEQLVRYLWRGIVNGLIIGLAGVGLSMTYSILNFANFAHGDYITSGAFAGWAATYLVAGFGTVNLAGLLLVGSNGNVYASDLGTSISQSPIAIVLGLLVAGLFAIVLSLALDRVIYRPMRNEEGIALLIASIGVAFLLRYLVVFVFGQSVRSVTATPESITIPLGIADLTTNLHQLTVVVAAVVFMLSIHVLLQRTKLGKAMRAMADNKALAQVTGIPTERVIRWTWIIGAGLAGVAGYLLILEAGTISYNRGWLLLLPIFAAVILGGIGSVYGAIYGGLIIGITEAIAIIWIPSDFGRAAAFGIMILVLLFKPHGLFAGRVTA